MPTMKTLIGARVTRVEDPRLVRGLGSYVDDIQLPRMLHAAFVRSQHAAGRVRAIDAARALVVPGVVAAFTYEDMRGEVGRTPIVFPPQQDAPRPLLADGVVVHVGQPLAVVIAEDRYAARDGALAVEVDIEPLPAVVDMEAALAPGAPRVHAALPDNVCFRAVSDNPRTDELFRAAAGTVKLRLVNQRVAPVSMEGRAVLAQWDDGAQKLTVWTSTQMPHGVKQQLAINLGIPETRIRAIAPDVGGGFGAKIPAYSEDFVLGWVTRRLARPVKWSETRAENLLATTHGRAHVEYVEAAYTADGEVTGLRLRTVADVGAFASFVGAMVPNETPMMVCGCYNIQAVSSELVEVYTNTMQVEAYRGAGRPEAAYIIERVMDAVAAALGRDPVEVRRRNFIPSDAFPYTTPTGAAYDSGNYPIALDRACELFDYAGARRAQAQARGEGRLVGIGVASFTEVCAFGPSALALPGMRSGFWESAHVRVEPTGSATVMTGTSPHGQGGVTTFAQIVGDILGLPLEDVVVLHSDTDVVTHGVGTFGSRALAVGGSAVKMAADRVLGKARRIAAHLLEVHERDLEFADGMFSAVGGGPRITFREVAMAAHVWNRPVPNEDPGLEAVARFDPAGFTFPFATQICQVEVDPDTGQIEIQRYVSVDDVGHVINPLLVDGQRLGGIVQGLGQAWVEEIRYDEGGQLVTGSLMDYAVPRASMFPRFELDTTVTPTPLNPLGAKGVGELGTIGAAPCLVNAVLDALRPLGVTQLDMPLKPERVWQAIAAAPGAPR
ncbi:MAG: xanthine dehydrogenase family protein molybdopterin-binding subunit [Candidatus Binatia bacterium]